METVTQRVGHNDGAQVRSVGWLDSECVKPAASGDAVASQRRHGCDDTPRCLDLFCGAGGASMGIHRAGFDVTGVDIAPQPRYPFEFRQGDALQVDLNGFDFVWASPPCQRYTRAQNAAKNAHAHPDLVAPIRAKLEAWGGPWIIENVVGAPLRNPLTRCGLAFGLNVKRHRLFESNLFLLAPPCPSHDADYFVIFGHEVRNRRHGQSAGRKNKIAEGRKAMGIDWMTRGELSESIPPAYSEFLAKQVARIIAAVASEPTTLAAQERGSRNTTEQESNARGERPGPSDA